MNDAKIVAIDFGSKKLSASLGKIDTDEVVILGTTDVKAFGIEKGVIIDKEKCQSSVSKLLENLKEDTNEGFNGVYAGISSFSLRSREISEQVIMQEGKVSNKLINKAIRYRIKNIPLMNNEEIVDYIINYYEIDNKIKTENIDGWLADNLIVNFTVFIGIKENLKIYRDIINNLGYKFNGFLVNIVAGKKIFLNEKTEGIKVLVDIGAGCTDIAIFDNGILRSVNYLPLGGNNVTKDLAICCKLPLSEAENIKIICSDNYRKMYENESIDEMVLIGNSKIPKELLFQVINARLEEILNLVNTELKNTSYYEGICSIIIYGDGVSYYENIKSLLKIEFSKKTIIVTKDYLGMNNSMDITSLALVKDVYDRKMLLQQKSIDNRKEKYEINGTKKTKGVLLNRLKGFLGDIF